MNIIVTGCSRGIGLELVKHFAQVKDAKIMGLARNREVLLKLEQSLGKDKFKGVAFDLLEIREKWTILECEINAYFKHIDIIVNNAGVLYNKLFVKTNMHEIERTFMANVFAPMELIRRLLPFLENSKHAHVVNIGSMGGFQGSEKFPGISWYSSSKAALACLTECLAAELQESNISCNCLALGAVQTEMLTTAFPGYLAPVNANEMAEFIANFAQTGHKLFNGKVIPVALSNPK